MRLLIVEDDTDARDLLKLIIADLGEIDTATNGHEAVKAFTTAHKTKRPYDLVLLDIMLPKLNGRNALKRIRKFEQEKKIFGKRQVPVIMVSALSDPENIIGSFFKEGCEAYVTKPYTREALLTQIKKVL